MKNRLTFTNVIGILLDNKKKTYQQHQLVRSLFSLSLDDSENSFDYAIYQMGKGIIALSQNNSEKAELCLLEAEQKITTIMGTDSDYCKTCYRYLHNLYSRWHKREKALEYKEKLLTL